MYDNLIIRVIFDANFENLLEIMFEFDQYLGWLAFLMILTMGFWLMIFLVMVIPYWIGGNLMEAMRERKAAKAAKQDE